jgi:hypothetical protein
MDVGTAAANQLPVWAYFALVGLGSLCGIFFMFVLGILAKRTEGGGGHVDGLAGHHPDCSNCAPIRRVEASLSALNSRIDNLLLEFGKAGN